MKESHIPIPLTTHSLVMSETWLGACVSLIVVILLFVLLLRQLKQVRQEKSELQLTLQRCESMLDHLWFWKTDAQGHLHMIRLPRDLESPGSSTHHHATEPTLLSTKIGQAIWLSIIPVNDADTVPFKMNFQERRSIKTTAIQMVNEPHNSAKQQWWIKGEPIVDHQGVFWGHEGLLWSSPSSSSLVDKPQTTLPAQGDADNQSHNEETPPKTSGLDSQQLLISSVSHDLRAPLRVVEGFVSILKEDYENALDRIGLGYLDRIEAAALRMNAMIDSLLSLSRLSMSRPSMESVNLSQLVHWVSNDLQNQQPHRQVTLHIESDLQVLADPIQLRSVVENLIGNAWKYTCQQTPAVIEVGRVGPPQAGFQCFVVQDNGVGFDMRFASKLFAPFHRLHSASEFEGTGIGLASVRSIVEKHGGRIWAQSSPNQGTQFYFTLPVHGDRH